MHCFRFASWERDADERRGPAAAAVTTMGRSLSARSNSSTTSTDRDVRRSASECLLNASSSSQRPPNPLQELKSATRGFSRALMLGEAGFGCVYRGTIRSSSRSVDVAIKQLGRKGLQGHKEWMTEVNVLGVVDHANLVKLIGYCAEDDERGIFNLL